MDAEIIYDNGERFKLSDLSVEVTDFKVSSMVKQSVYEDIEGANRVDFGAEYKHRTISIPFVMTAYDLHDFAHLRNEIFAKVDSLESFYIREMRRPIRRQYAFVNFNEKPKEREGADNQYVDGKQYRVRLVNVIEIEQRGVKGDGVLVFETTESPYAQSVYTSLELHDSGYSAIADKYGLVDNIDDEKVKYRFGPGLKKVTLKASDFEQGSIASVSGANVANASEIRMVSYFDTVPGETLTFKDAINGDNINYWWLFEYDKNGDYIGFSNTPIGGNGESKFVARGHRLRVRSTSYNGIKPEDIGVHTLPTLEVAERINNFTVYNAGNVTVEPESMFLHIFVSNVTGSELIIRNNTTNEEFKLTNNMIGRHIQVNGMIVLNGTINMFRNTNRRFISLAPGDNDITVTGATFNEIRFNFKYLYK